MLFITLYKPMEPCRYLIICSHVTQDRCAALQALMGQLHDCREDLQEVMGQLVENLDALSNSSNPPVAWLKVLPDS